MAGPVKNLSPSRRLPGGCTKGANPSSTSLLVFARSVDDVALLVAGWPSAENMFIPESSSECFFQQELLSTPLSSSPAVAASSTSKDVQALLSTVVYEIAILFGLADLLGVLSNPLAPAALLLHSKKACIRSCQRRNQAFVGCSSCPTEIDAMRQVHGAI